MGIDAASSAQSKREGTGVKRGCTELKGGSTRDGGRKTVVAGDSDASAVVEDTGGGETTRSRGVWGGLGGWDKFRVHSDESGTVFRRFRAVACCPEWGRMQGLAIVDRRVDGDVADV
jgi:hypothetical protein